MLPVGSSAMFGRKTPTVGNVRDVPKSATLIAIPLIGRLFDTVPLSTLGAVTTENATLK